MGKPDGIAAEGAHVFITGRRQAELDRLYAVVKAQPVAATRDERLLVALFLVYGLGQGLGQPALINTVIGGSGVSGEDAGSAAGLFLTTAQASIAFGVAVIGGVFFTRLGPVPTATSYVDALSLAFSCNLVLLGAAFVLMLVLLLPRRHRWAPAAAVDVPPPVSGSH